MSKKTSDEVKKEIMSLYSSGVTAFNIASQVGLVRQTVLNILRQNGVAIKSSSESRRVSKPINSGAFKTLSNEQDAYWYGFLLADGCINGKSIYVKISAKDKDHVEKYRDFIAPCSHISYSLSNVHPMVSLNIHSSTLVDNLRSHGFEERKSTREKYPQDLPEEMERHFWRGMVDGDGCLIIHYNKGMIVPVVSLLGSLEICSRFKQFVLKTVKTEAQIYPHRNIWVFKVGGSKSARFVADILYKDSVIFLERKYQKYLEMMRGKTFKDAATSRFVGVSQKVNKWAATYHVRGTGRSSDGGRQIYLGSFCTEEEASKAYQDFKASVEGSL